MSVTGPSDWMTVEDLIKETGMSRSAAYNAASTGSLPVPVYRFGRRYMISRQAFESLKTLQHPDHQVSEPELTGAIRDAV